MLAVDWDQPRDGLPCNGIDGLSSNSSKNSTDGSTNFNNNDKNDNRNNIDIQELCRESAKAYGKVVEILPWIRLLLLGSVPKKGS